MKKPTKPRKPTRPTPPPKTIANTPVIEYLYSNITIKDLLEKVGNVNYSKCCLVIQSSWDNTEIYLEKPGDPSEVDNPYYPARYKEYKRKLQNYNKKLIKYNADYIKYENDMATYLRWVKEEEEKTELAQLAKLKKKYESSSC